MKILEQLRQENRTADMAALVEAIPYARFLGIQVEREGDELTTMLPYLEMLIGNPTLPAVHGGVLGSFLELTSVIQLLFNTSCETFPRTVDISVDYLRSGKPQDLYGRAIVTRQGRRVANVRAEIWQEDQKKPIAAAHGHYLLMPSGE